MMSQYKVFSIVVASGLILFVLGLAVVSSPFAVVAATDAVATRRVDSWDIASIDSRAQLTMPMTAINTTPDINNTIVALVVQPSAEKLHAFNALTGQWSTLEGADFKVENDDVAYASNLVVLVVQYGQDKLHAFSALTGQWATLEGIDFRVSADDVIKIRDSVIVVAQPGQEQIHAFSALTGRWATLGGAGFSVSTDNKILVGSDN